MRLGSWHSSGRALLLLLAPSAPHTPPHSPSHTATLPANIALSHSQVCASGLGVQGHAAAPRTHLCAAHGQGAAGGGPGGWAGGWETCVAYAHGLLLNPNGITCDRQEVDPYQLPIAFACLCVLLCSTQPLITHQMLDILGTTAATASFALRVKVFAYPEGLTR